MKRRRTSVRAVAPRPDRAVSSVLSAQRRGETPTGDAEVWKAIIRRLAVEAELLDAA